MRLSESRDAQRCARFASESVFPAAGHNPSGRGCPLWGCRPVGFGLSPRWDSLGGGRAVSPAHCGADEVSANTRHRELPRPSSQAVSRAAEPGLHSWNGGPRGPQVRFEDR